MNDSTRASAERAGVTRVRLQLFGTFREYSRGGVLTLDVPAGITVAALRAHLKETLSRALPARCPGPLVDVSALASDEGVLPEAHRLSDAEVRLSLLPPVCGG